jgi:hypothetical protein
MLIQTGIKQIQIDGYLQLDEQCDAAFRTLFEHFFADPTADFATLLNAYLPPFEAEMRAFFSRHAESSPLQDQFFTNLTIVWKRYFDAGRFPEAKAFWNRIVTTTRAWEQQTGLRVHKGSALYFWAVTALLQGEIDKGFLLMHAAVDEDVLTLNTPFPRTPAFMFATLDFSEPRQFFYPYVKGLAEFLEPFTSSYGALRGTQFTMAQFKDRFLSHPPSTLTVFSFTHALARFHLLHRVPPYTIQSPFAGQYQLSVLSDLALVIDEALAHKGPNHWRFIDLAAFLSAQSALGLSRDDLAYANSSIEQAFDPTLTALVDGVFRFQDGIPRSRLACDLAICHCIRNHSAHNLASFPSIPARYSDLARGFMNVLFLAVEVLY